MPRPLLLLILLIVIVLGALFVLQSLAREVPQTRIEKPVAPEILEH